GERAWADGQGGDGGAGRVGRPERAVSSRHRTRRTATAVNGGDRTHNRHRYDKDENSRDEKRPPLCRRRTKGFYRPHSAFGSDDPIGPDHAARAGRAPFGSLSSICTKPSVTAWKSS